ncbi:hypothetical protein HY643_01710 [Candidatus Woesearchaeota archaeon]|nr:hypothetical protein [Candidatus Woesearchaeota archaeon]
MGKGGNTAAVKEYLKNNPYLADALKKDVVNYSKLARTIIKESHLHLAFEAVVVACRRYKKEVKLQKEAVQTILKESSINAENGMAVAIAENVAAQKIMEKIPEGYFMKGTSGTTIILKEREIDGVLPLFKEGSVKRNVLALTFQSQKDMGKIPGLIGHLTGLFGNHGVPILGMLSSSHEIVVAIQKRDISKIVDALKARY